MMIILGFSALFNIIQQIMFIYYNISTLNIVIYSYEIENDFYKIASYKKKNGRRFNLQTVILKNFL
ncbi:hypothetical protein ASL14_00675 [Paenibacillus sp. IHB B 3084]|nr:hypothetical protein ASL14_00675 [Paenibacillus sp. IHB B 3084]